MPTYVALLRGINVGKAKRVAMADLREIVAGLGHSNVKTLLNSGNVVFDASRKLPAKAADALQAAILEATGVSSQVTLLTAGELEAALDACPLLDVADDRSRLFVAVVRRLTEELRVLEEQDWSPERFALGPRVAYLWCPEGVRDSRLGKAVAEAMGDEVTMRNWKTMTKVAQAL